MSEFLTLKPIELPISGFVDIAEEAAVQGHVFLNRMSEEWADGSNRFSLSGEVMFGAFDGERLIAVGGLNQCPYCGDPKIGRLRHLYVSSANRHKGIASTLIGKIMSSAINNFEVVRLRTNNPSATKLYEQLGFVSSSDANASHEIFP